MLASLQVWYLGPFAAASVLYGPARLLRYYPLLSTGLKAGERTDVLSPSLSVVFF